MSWFSKKYKPTQSPSDRDKIYEETMKRISSQENLMRQELAAYQKSMTATAGVSTHSSGNNASYHSGSAGGSSGGYSGYTYRNKTTTAIVSGYPPKTTSASGGSWQLEDAPRNPYQDESMILADHIDKLEAKISELQDLLEATAGGVNERLADIEEDLYGA